MEKTILSLELCQIVVQGTQLLCGAVFSGSQWAGISVTAHGLAPAAGAGRPGEGGCQGMMGHEPV